MKLHSAFIGHSRYRLETGDSRAVGIEVGITHAAEKERARGRRIAGLFAVARGDDAPDIVARAPAGDNFDERTDRDAHHAVQEAVADDPDAREFTGAFERYRQHRAHGRSARRQHAAEGDEIEFTDEIGGGPFETLGIDRFPNVVRKAAD